MKTLLIKLLLLLSLSFNIAHATFIALEDDHTVCHHDTVAAFVMEQSADTDCGDLCEMHHFFHFMAIVETPIVTPAPRIGEETPVLTKTLYDTSIPQRDIKPPIV